MQFVVLFELPQGQICPASLIPSLILPDKKRNPQWLPWCCQSAHEPIRGGAIQVMLSEDSCYSGPRAELEKLGGLREHYGAARSMSPMWIKVVQEKRPHSYGETKPLLQTVWPGVCPQSRKSTDHRGATHAD